MVTRLELKLLHLTNRQKRISVDDLPKEMQTESIDLELHSLKERGILNLSHGFLEVSSRQRVMLAEELVRSGQDAQKVSRLLAWQEFEEFVEAALDQSGFQSVRHLVFKSKLGRHEIDVLAWSDAWILTIDCKHWSRTLVHSRMKSAAEAQLERARALAERPEIMQRHGVPRIDLPLVPVILTLGEPADRFIGGVPIVGLSRFSSFLQEASPYTNGILIVQVHTRLKQTSLSSHIHPQKRNRMPNLIQNGGRLQS